MNTYDIRNMNTKQWLFRATAVPVTVPVMGLAVVAVLNFDPVRGLWARVVDRDDSQRVGREELRGIFGWRCGLPQGRPTIVWDAAGTTAPDRKVDTTGWAKAQAIHGLYLTCCDGGNYANTWC